MFVVVYITFVALAVIMVSFIVSKFMGALHEQGPVSTEVQSVIDSTSMMPHYYDYTFLTLVLILTAGLLITSFLIPTHPMFVVVNIVGIIILVIFSMILSNIFGYVATDVGFEDFALQFPFTVFIMQYLPWICVTISLLATIVMYAKSQSSGGQG